MPYAAVNDIRMYVEEEGRGEPLLLLHGGLGAIDPAVSSSWAALLQPSEQVRVSRRAPWKQWRLDECGPRRSAPPTSLSA